MHTKTTIKIDGRSREVLVNLLATATYGSSWLEVFVEHSTRQLLNIEDSDCREDVWAKALLAGYPIFATDWQAEGETYGNVCQAVLDRDNDEGSATYTIRLEDVVRGLQSALDGTFKVNGEHEAANARRSALDLLGDDVDFDADEADVLMQIIMFNELIYC